MIRQDLGENKMSAMKEAAYIMFLHFYVCIMEWLPIMYDMKDKK